MPGIDFNTIESFKTERRFSKSPISPRRTSRNIDANHKLDYNIRQNKSEKCPRLEYLWFYTLFMLILIFIGQLSAVQKVQNNS